MGLSPVPHVGFGAVDARLLQCGDVFQQAAIQFRGATDGCPSKAASRCFLKPRCSLGPLDPAKRLAVLMSKGAARFPPRALSDDSSAGGWPWLLGQ